MNETREISKAVLTEFALGTLCSAHKVHAVLFVFGEEWILFGNSNRVALLVSV